MVNAVGQFLTHIVLIAEHAVAPWAKLYRASNAVSTVTTFLHIAGLMVAGGFALATDRATLRMLRELRTSRTTGHDPMRSSVDPELRATCERQLEHVRAIHRPVLLGLVVVVVSGFLMAASDAATFLGSPLFWAKMTLFVILLTNGWVMARTEATLRTSPEVPALWSRMRTTSIVSAVLWLSVALSGTALTSYA